MGLPRSRKHVISVAILFWVLGLCTDLSSGHQGHQSGFCTSQVISHDSHGHHSHCDHGHDNHHQDKLPEELAEEEDMKLYGFGPYHSHSHSHSAPSELSGFGLWFNALGCSFLVSMASLICLTILPLICAEGKPSQAVVDSLALFGAGAMLGDAFLHQLPHAFGGEHSHSHSHHDNHSQNNDLGHEHGHAHSLKDLSIGISVLAGIVLFLLVEKVVRHVEEKSGGDKGWSHGHHHHHHKSNKPVKSDNGTNISMKPKTDSLKDGVLVNEARSSDQAPGDAEKRDDRSHCGSGLRKRGGKNGDGDDEPLVDSVDGFSNFVNDKEPVPLPTNLVFGYLNLFSDGVHNFTDGMALGSAFLLYGSVGGWSRTLFLLAHELPQEVGDFGILVRSGFSITKALSFNFLSALVALAGTALALLWGQDPGQSSLIEGFTAGGFIYIAVAGVLAEMNSSGNSSLKSTATQLISLILGMTVALFISLVE